MEFPRPHSKYRAAILTAAVLAGAAGLHPASADTYTDPVIDRTAGGQAVGSATSDTDGFGHALLWLSNGTLVDLNPAGFRNSGANDTNGSQQVGSAYSTTTSSSHAVIWSGTASVIDLNPATGYEFSTSAEGISPDGSQQVGIGYGSATNYTANALLWSSTAASVVNLQTSNSLGFNRSFAYATDGTYQVGYGEYGTSSSAHALLWNGTAASAVDLHPASGFTDSFAEGVGGGQQVGYGYTSGTFSVQALLWTGTAASVVNLTPATYNGASAYSTNGIKQVGYGQDATFTNHALVWSGTAASAVDLSALLPGPGAWTFSIAYDIDSTGDIFGWANGTYNSVQGTYAIEWTPNLLPSADLFSPDAASVPQYTADVLYLASVPVASSVPEPASLSLLLLTAPALLRRRRH